MIIFCFKQQQRSVNKQQQQKRNAFTIVAVILLMVLCQVRNGWRTTNSIICSFCEKPSIRVQDNREIMIIGNSSNNDNNNNDDNYNNNMNTFSNSTSPDDDILIRLRFDWTKLTPFSAAAKSIRRHQKQLCSLPLGYHEHRPQAGIGSNLLVWTQALCVGMQRGYRIHTAVSWNALDQELCQPKNMLSSMTCYFPQSELACPNDVPTGTDKSGHKRIFVRQDMDPTHPVPPMHNIKAEEGYGKVSDWEHSLMSGCPEVLHKHGIPEFTAGGIEYLFSPVSNVVQKEAERQLLILFGEHGRVPENLITVHIRWGDKFVEMPAVPIEQYVQAVKDLINERQFYLSNSTSIAQASNDTTVASGFVDNNSSKKTKGRTKYHIYVASEDPKAITKFRQASPKNWIIYSDVWIQMYGRDRRALDRGLHEQHVHISDMFRGRPSLVALGSLLVSMEANDFVLTKGSNWSRLIDELRKNVINPRCHNCTQILNLGTTY